MKHSFSFDFAHLYVSPTAIGETALNREGLPSMFMHNTNLVALPAKLTFSEIVEAIDDFSFLTQRLTNLLLDVAKTKVLSRDQFRKYCEKIDPGEGRFVMKLGDSEGVEIEIKVGDIQLVDTDNESEDLSLPDFLIDLFKDEGIPTSVAENCMNSDESYRTI